MRKAGPHIFVLTDPGRADPIFCNLAILAGPALVGVAES